MLAASNYIDRLARVPVSQRQKPRLGVSGGHKHYKWWALSCTSLGMLLATVNSGTLIIALPDLERALHTSILSLVWVILAYMIASTVLVLTAGRMSDVFGRKRAYVGGFVLFGLASLGAGFASDGTVLILWRVLQGIAAAFLFANSSALVTDAFPREQLGLAMGTNTMVAAIGLVLGPVLGGALVSISWHWVFWFNVPLTAIGALWAALVLRERAKPDEVRGLDPLGTLTFVVGLTGLVLGISRGGISGWNDPVTIGALVVGALLLPLFVILERRQQAPMLDLSIFRNRMFAAATGAAFINGLSRFALMFVFVFYFQGVKGDDPITAGLKLAPLAIGMLIASPLAGLWADRHGSRALSAAGMVVSAGALAGMTTLGVDSSYWLSTLSAVRRGRGVRDVQQPQHRGNDGHGGSEPPWHRGGYSDDAAKHRRGDLNRVRAGDHHCGGSQGRAFQDLLGRDHRALEPDTGAVRAQHAHRALGARRHVDGRRGRFAAAAPSRPRDQGSARPAPQRRSRNPPSG